MNRNLYDVSGEGELLDVSSYFNRIAVPCIVEAYDKKTHSVIVRPAIKDETFADDLEVAEEEREPLESIPVLDWAKIRITPEAGHHGILLFTDRNIDNYLVSRLLSEEQTNRVHDYNDAVFMPTESAYVGRPEPLIVIEGENVTINCETFTVNADKFVKNGIDQITINGQGGTPLE